MHVLLGSIAPISQNLTFENPVHHCRCCLFKGSDFLGFFLNLTPSSCLSKPFLPFLVIFQNSAALSVRSTDEKSSKIWQKLRKTLCNLRSNSTTPNQTFENPIHPYLLLPFLWIRLFSFF